MRLYLIYNFLGKKNHLTKSGANSIFALQKQSRSDIMGQGNLKMKLEITLTCSSNTMAVVA